MNKAPASSPLSRLVQLGSLVGRVGASVAIEHLLSLTRSTPSRQARRLDNLVLNAGRIVQELGELKGAAMKVGQMLSLQDGMLPPEVTEVLRVLQKQAPPIPFELVQRQLDIELPGWRRMFKELEPRAIAAASIGQVHRGELVDGRRVAVKIQYPGIDGIIESDLVNLRRLLKSLFALFIDTDFGPVWMELRDRLREEIDYLNEAENIRRMTALWAGSDEVVIPGVVEEASSRRVLTMDYVAGLAPDQACAEGQQEALRNRWGEVLFKLVLRGLFEHRLIHADPNLSNFSFLPDGRIIVYDFGCVKSVPLPIANGYRALCHAVLDGRQSEIPALLAAMGICTGEGRPLTQALIAPVLGLVTKLLDDKHLYRFGFDDRLFAQLLSAHAAGVGEVKDLHFPPHIVFIQRTAAGHFGNLSRLRAVAPWRQMLEARLAQNEAGDTLEIMPV